MVFASARALAQHRPPSDPRVYHRPHPTMVLLQRRRVAAAAARRGLNMRI